MSSSNNSPGKFHVLYDYESGAQDELTLKRGSVVEVVSTDSRVSGTDGWWLGRLDETSPVGLLPAKFVAKSAPSLCVIDEKDLEIGDFVGAGAFGQVHMGKYKDKPVALKSTKSFAMYCSSKTSIHQGSNDKQLSGLQKKLAEDLVQEACLFSFLDHPNIIKLFGISILVSTGTICLVMERAFGGALNSLLDRRKRGLSPNVLILYAKQMAEGLQYLHEEVSEPIIHRDFKSSNILICESINNVLDDNELLYKCIKITDFGLAKPVKSSETGTCGTYPWMSPECIQGKESSPKMDVWSFGVVMWECLTGEIPYKGCVPAQVGYGVATGRCSLPIPKTCPNDIADLIKDCWKYNAEERPTMNGILQRISEVATRNYSNNETFATESCDEFISSLESLRHELKLIAEELTAKEKQIREREEQIAKEAIEHTNARTALDKREQDLDLREMELIERELKLAISQVDFNQRKRKPPKINKRSGGSLLALITSTIRGYHQPSLSPVSNLISHPQNFQYIMSVRRTEGTPLLDNNRPALEYVSPSAIRKTSIEASSRSNSADGDVGSPPTDMVRSTPTTPNLAKFRALTFKRGRELEGAKSKADMRHSQLSKRSSSSGSNKKTSHHRRHLPWHKRKSQSTSEDKGSNTKSRARVGEPKWYIDSALPQNSKPDNSDDSVILSTKSTPALNGRPERPGAFSFSTSSISSMSNDHSLSCGILTIHHVLTAVGFGSCGLGKIRSSRLSSSTTSANSSSTSIASGTALLSKNYAVIRSTSEIVHDQKPLIPSSNDGNLPSSRKILHKRTASSPIGKIVPQTVQPRQDTNVQTSAASQTLPVSSSWSSTPVPLSSKASTISQSDSQLVNSDRPHEKKSGRKYTSLFGTKKKSKDTFKGYLPDISTVNSRSNPPSRTTSSCILDFEFLDHDNDPSPETDQEKGPQFK